MWTWHSEAWDDIRWANNRNHPRIKSTTNTKNISNSPIQQDDEILGMIEVITTMRVENMLGMWQVWTKEQIFFDEIGKAIEYINRASRLEKNKVGTIRNIALWLWIKRVLIDGYFLYQNILSIWNIEYRKRLHQYLDSLQWKNENVLVEHWERYKKFYSPTISSFNNFKKLVWFYSHQQ